MIAVPIILIILIIAALVMTFRFILPESRASQLGGIWLRMHDFLSMKELYLEKILRTFYAIASVITFVLCVGGGLLAPFIMPNRSFGKILLGIPLGLIIGLLLAVIFLFFTRIFYESIMLKISLTKAAKDINEKIGGGSRSYDEPRRRPAPQRPAPAVCRRCGTRFDPRRGYCPNCDEPW